MYSVYELPPSNQWYTWMDSNMGLSVCVIGYDDGRKRSQRAVDCGQNTQSQSNLQLLPTGDSSSFTQILYNNFSYKVRTYVTKAVHFFPLRQRKQQQLHRRQDGSCSGGLRTNHFQGRGGMLIRCVPQRTTTNVVTVQRGARGGSG